MKILESQPKLVEQVHKAILAEIAEGKLRPGERIIQEQIARELGVSRQPVQQALVLLKNQGVLRDAPGRGLLVAPLNLHFVRQMYEMRSVIEGLAFRKAAEHFNAEANTRGERLLAAGREAVRKGSVADMIAADMAFHTFIYELAGNPLIGPVMETQWVNAQRVMGSVLLSADKPRDIWDEHEALFKLVASGDGPRAEQAARKHLEDAADFMIARMGESSSAEYAA
ncbi:MAG: GntR family transcriptional regulator [Oxalobacteraceae bacterium]